MFEAEGFPNCEVDTPLEQLFLNRRRGMFEAGGWDAFQHKLRYQQNLSEVHDMMRRLRQVVDEYDACILLGETGEVDYYGNGQDELHSVFSFPLISKLDAPLMRQTLAERLPTIPKGAWEANTVGNHDRSRSFSYYADGRDDDLRARVALAMVMFLRGTPVFYNGEEIGMRDVRPASVEDFKDGLGVWFYHALQRQGATKEEAYEIAVTYFCRDRCRTPMQWANQPHAGFSPAHVSPWLPVGQSYTAGINVAEQEADPTSMLTFFRQLVQVRQTHQALRLGDISLMLDTGNVLAFWRHTAEQKCLVALNMSAERVTLPLKNDIINLYTSRSSQPRVTGQLTLQPYEIWVGEVA